MRSLLFGPGDRADMVGKLLRSDADAVVLDLEDAVAPTGKEAARQVVVQTLSTSERGSADVYVRVNRPGSSWFDSDIDALLAVSDVGIVVPKVETAGEHELLLRRAAGRPMILGLETVRGVAGAEEILAEGGSAAYFGAEDFITDLGGVRTRAGQETLYARSRVAIAARLAGVGILDQAVLDFRDDERFRSDALEGRALGYIGKICIHPAQVALCREVFSPAADEVDRGRRMIAAYDRAVAGGRGVIEFEGEMVDRPMVDRAIAMLARAGALRE